MSFPDMSLSGARTDSTPSYASDEQESKHLKRSKILHWIKLGLSVVILGAATTVVGCEAHALQHYKETRNFEKWWLALWPQEFDLRPTMALLGAGIAIMVTILVYMIVAAFPSPHPRTTVLNSLASGAAGAGLIASITVVAFSTQITKEPRIIGGVDVSETIETWSCKWSSARNMGVMDNNGEPLTAPDGFGRVCTETRAAFALMNILVCLEVLMAATALCGWWFERIMKKERENSVAEMKNESMQRGHKDMSV